MPLSQLDIDTLVDAMPFKRRSRWQELADRLQAQTQENDSQTYSRLYKWAGISFKQLQFVLNTPDEVLFTMAPQRLAGIFQTVAGRIPVYTAPQGKVTRITQLSCSNNNAQTSIVAMYITSAGSDTTESDQLAPSLRKLETISSLVLNTNIELKPGDFISFYSNTGALAFTIYGY